MKILVFIASIDKTKGGPSRSVPILVKGLSEIGVDVTLATYRSNDMNDGALAGTTAGLKLFECGEGVREMEDYIKTEQFDVIHTQCIWDPQYAQMHIVARKLGVPYMMTPRGMLEPWSLSQKKWKKKLAMMLYQRRDLNKAACILATSDMEAQHVRELGITAPVAVIPNGIDMSEYKCRPVESRSSVKKQILFLSRIHEKKGIELLIAAWEQLAGMYPDWNVLIAGNGEDSYIKRLKELIYSRDLQSSVKIVPPVFGQDKYDLYCESSLFVLPTYSENFGMVIAEAMSCGVPVITTNETPWQELNENKLGWCIDLSVENLVNSISEAAGMGVEVLFEQGQLCSKYIANNYQYTAVARRNEELYEWLLGMREGGEFAHLYSSAND